MRKTKKIVVIGGGTGSFTVLSGLKEHANINLTAIVSMADDGGSTGILRDEYGVLPPGDIRQCLVALSEEEKVLRDLFNFRFGSGGLKGHSFGNLFISALEKVTGNFDKALEEAGKILKVKGEVIPVTLDKVRLVAELGNGKKLYGEGAIMNYQMISRFGVKKIYLDKKAKANKKALEAIKEADLIVVGPGGFYSSLIPNFLVSEVPKAIKASKARKVFIANIMNKYGHTDDFTADDFVKGVEKFAGKGLFDVVLCNNKIPRKELLKKYLDEGEPVSCKIKNNKEPDYKLICLDLLDEKAAKVDKNSTMIQRSFIRHDPKKIGKAIMKILKN